jgi:hypothetical protein
VEPAEAATFFNGGGGAIALAVFLAADGGDGQDEQRGGGTEHDGLPIDAALCTRNKASARAKRAPAAGT